MNSPTPTAVTILPEHAKAVSLYAEGRLTESESLLRKVVEIQPNNAAAKSHLAAVLSGLGRHTEASDFAAAATKLDPNNADLLYNYAVILDGNGNTTEAIKTYERLLHLSPSNAAGWYNLAGLLNREKDVDGAIRCYKQALQVQPKYLKAILSLATLLQKEKKQLKEALELIRTALVHYPEEAKPNRRMGLLSYDNGNLADAMKYVSKAYELQPMDSDNCFSLAGLKYVTGNYDEAERLYDETLKLSPTHSDAIMGKSLLELSLGRWNNAWTGYEQRLKKNPVYEQLSQKPRWDGSPLNGRTLLVYAEQGLGDTFQFIRYLDRLEEQNGRVVTLVSKPLMPILKLSGYQNIYNGTHEAPPYDVQIPLMSLASVFGDTPESLPKAVPYIRSDETLREKWKKYLDQFSGLRIGIHWQGNPSFGRDKFRSVPLELFEPISKLKNVKLFSLQKNVGLDQIQKVSDRFEVIDLDAEMKLDEQTAPFMDTAALIDNLDLIITSDSAVAHLAGAMGAPVWLITAYSPDWRWMVKRTDSPWYPTMKLFRQEAIEEWKPVFEEMARRLKNAKPTSFREEAKIKRGNAVAKALTRPPVLEEVKIPETKPSTGDVRWPAKFQEGTKLHNAGERDKAEIIYKEILADEPNIAEVNHALGVLLFEKADYVHSIRYFRLAIAADPKNALYYRNAAPAIQLSGGSNDEAIEFAEKSIEIQPHDPEAHFNLAGLYSTKGDFAAAEKCYRETLRLSPQHVQAWLNLGQMQQKQDQKAEAISSFQRAFAIKESDLNAGKTLAKLLSAEGRHIEAARVWRRMALHHKKSVAVASGLGEALDDWYRAPYFGADENKDDSAPPSEKILAEREDILVQAILAYREAARIAPDNAIVWGKLGAALSNASRVGEALQCFENALKLKPKFTQVALAMAQALNNEHKFKEAIAHCQKCLKEMPKEAGLWRVLAASLRGKGDIVEAEEAAKKSLEFAPNDWESRAELMYIASHQGNWKEAIDIGKQLVAEKPGDIRAELELTLQSLRFGDLPQGWKDYECRRRLTKWRSCVPGGTVSSLVDWMGEPLEGKTLLIYHEQGLGDTIQFIRYYDLLKNLDGKVYLQVHPPLVNLLQQSGYENVLSRDTPTPKFDYAMPLMSLPYVFGHDLNTMPKRVPYLSAKPELIEHWTKFLRQREGFYIGIHWQGSPHFKADCYRSFPLTNYESIAKVPGVRLFSLQKNFGTEQIAALNGRFEVIDRGFELDERNGAFQDTAALIKSLDHIITSDSAVAHLAGALGVRVWLIVPVGCDWRFGYEGSQCAWYPTMKLYRQSKVGKWDDVFQKITVDLAALMGRA